MILAKGGNSYFQINFMKTILLFFVCLLTSSTYSQSFTGEMGYIFNGETNKEFFGGIEIKSGSIKKNDKIDIYAETGRKFQATIKKITLKGNEVASAKAGQEVTIDFETTEDATTGKDYLRKGYKVYPKDFKLTVVKSNNITGFPDKVTALVAGKPYRAASLNNGFYKKGVKGFAVNNDTTDTRSFVLHIYNPKEGIATYGTETTELNFSGAADGVKDHEKIYGYVKGSKNKFTIAITKWQRVSDTKIILSGTFEGTIKQVLTGKETLSIEKGVFESIEVSVFSKQESFVPRSN
jgi:hypothetical protein